MNLSERNISVVTWHMWTHPPLFYITCIFYFYVRIDSDRTSFFFLSFFRCWLSLYFSFDIVFFLEILKDFVKMQHLIRLIFDVFVVVEAPRHDFFLLLIFLLHFYPFGYIWIESDRSLLRGIISKKLKECFLSSIFHWESFWKGCLLKKICLIIYN